MKIPRWVKYAFIVITSAVAGDGAWAAGADMFEQSMASYNYAHGRYHCVYFNPNKSKVFSADSDPENPKKAKLIAKQRCLEAGADCSDYVYTCVTK